MTVASGADSIKTELMTPWLRRSYPRDGSRESNEVILRRLRGTEIGLTHRVAVVWYRGSNQLGHFVRNGTGARQVIAATIPSNACEADRGRR